MAERVSQEQPQGCLISLINFLVRGLMRLFGMSVRGVRATVMPPDETFKAYVDAWVSERIATWLHQTRAEINPEDAAKVLNGEGAHLHDVRRLIYETLIDAKVTFSQRDGKQYLEVEAYMAPRQQNGRQPHILRWRAEREIAWHDIPNDVRERLIRLREPVTLGYNVPQG
ncbi:MAG: hypothetical protein RML95_12905 [Anaerolineae bacterium]|nr:hypothetical protein [Anaerolineae bacterium]MDW8300225.1 hypothetical protein [Anaerolineae bacterium]